MKSDNKTNKVLLQLSGGKDSTACLILLKEKKINMEAIHFVHCFSYDLPTQMCKMVCMQLNVKLHIIDISEEIQSLLLNDFHERPCRYCKAIMDQKTVIYAQNNGYDTICVGDTADDTMLVNRIIAADGSISQFSRYLNAHITLPSNIVVYRPLIIETSHYTMNLVSSRFPTFKRVNDTGDKYFEYSREGCPLQFKDLGVCYTKELMIKLKKMNMLCSEFATIKGIKASIHLPSENIVTIPEGYEDECRKYLCDNGYDLNNPVQPEKSIHVSNISIRTNSSVTEKEFLKQAMYRFSERLNFKSSDTIENENYIEFQSNETYIISTYNKYFSIINIVIGSTSPYINNFNMKNICLEIFHTNNIYINQSIL